MKRSNDRRPDVRGGDLRTSVPVVFSPYKKCLSLFANINDCHGQSWPDPTRARSIWVRERSNTSPAWNKYSALFSRKDNPEHFMMQNICMATTTTTTFYQNELSRMQNKSIGKTATAQLHLFGQNRKLQFSAPFRRHPRILCVWRTEVLSSKLNVEDYCAQFQQWPWLRGPPARPYLAACCLLRRNTVIRNTQISAITIVIFHRHNFTQLSSTVR